MDGGTCKFQTHFCILKAQESVHQNPYQAQPGQFNRKELLK